MNIQSNNTKIRSLFKLSVSLFIALCITMQVFAQSQTQIRSKTKFNNDWKFSLSDNPKFMEPDCDDSIWRNLSLPHDWTIEGAFDEKNPCGASGAFLPGGIGWYRKTFLVNDSLKLKKVFIQFDGIHMNSEVWINNHFLGRYPNGYLTILYDLTPFLKVGQKNTIAVRVDNSLEPSTRYYGGAGIYRNTWLIVTNPTHFDNKKGVFVSFKNVSPQSATINCNYEIITNAFAGSEFEWWRQNPDLNVRITKQVKLSTFLLDTKGKVIEKISEEFPLGDFKKHEDYSMRSLAIEEKIFGSNSPKLFGTYGSLIIAYIELQDYERSLIYANLALSISGKNEAEINPLVLADLYNNLGVINIHLADYSKAKMYLEKSESIFEKNNHFDDENYINLMNNMAITYGALKLSDKSDEYYTKGITMAISLNSKISFNLVNSYAIILANNGNRQKGEILLNDALQRARRLYGENSQIYIEILNNYAEYLREYDIDNAKSLLNYEKCIGYLAGNNHDKLLMDAVNLGYSLSLNKAGESVKALETIQLMLFPEQAENKPVGLYDNPVKEFIKADKKHLRISVSTS